MNWAISNLTGSNRVSRALIVRYSTVPLAESVNDTPESSPVASQTTSSTTIAAATTTTSSTTTTSTTSSSFASNFLHSSRHHGPGRAVPRHAVHSSSSAVASSLPLDVEETVTCFCRKARRKERDGDQNSTDTKLYLEESVLERKLPEADLKALVDLPAGLDYNEWLASHTLALFEHVNLVYGTISEFCTPTVCPDMTGPGNRTYLWFDEKGKKTRVAAPQYIDYVMTFTQKTVSDESIFPTKYANEFPGSFESIARKILRLQFHVIAHLYAAHFREIALLGLHTHLNLTFAHLTALHRRFNLIDEKETDVLRDLEVALRLTDDTQQQQQQQANEQQPISQTTSSLSSTTVAATTTTTTTILTTATTQKPEDVNLLQTQSQQQPTSGLGPPYIDGDPGTAPICTQPEATAKPPGAAAAFVGVGSSNLIGGILGDLTTGEFGDTTRYCTSAVPSAAAAAAAADSCPPIEAATNCNNGAGALHLNFTTTAGATANNNNNNNNNINTNNISSSSNSDLHTSHHNHHTHHHHNNQHLHQLHHHHNHHHHHHHNNHYTPHPPPNSGLIQCNSTVAPSLAVVAATTSATAAASSAPTPTAASSTSSA